MIIFSIIHCLEHRVCACACAQCGFQPLRTRSSWIARRSCSLHRDFSLAVVVMTVSVSNSETLHSRSEPQTFNVNERPRTRAISTSRTRCCVQVVPYDPVPVHTNPGRTVQYVTRCFRYLLKLPVAHRSWNTIKVIEVLMRGPTTTTPPSPCQC